MPDLFEQYAQLYPRFRILNDQYENAKKRLAGEADDPDNIVKTIDEAADKVDRQIRKQLDKIGDNRK